MPTMCWKFRQAGISMIWSEIDLFLDFENIDVTKRCCPKHHNKLLFLVSILFTNVSTKITAAERNLHRFRNATTIKITNAHYFGRTISIFFNHIRNIRNETRLYLDHWTILNCSCHRTFCKWNKVIKENPFILAKSSKAISRQWIEFTPLVSTKM